MSDWNSDRQTDRQTLGLVQLEIFFRLPQLEIEKTRTEDCTVHYSTGEVPPIIAIIVMMSDILLSSGTFTCLAAVFKMKRSPGYLVFSTYIPSVLIVIMSWIRSDYKDF